MGLGAHGSACLYNLAKWGTKVRGLELAAAARALHVTLGDVKSQHRHLLTPK